jgi:hypothetical protein
MGEIGCRRERARRVGRPPDTADASLAFQFAGLSCRGTAQQQRNETAIDQKHASVVEQERRDHMIDGRAVLRGRVDISLFGIVEAAGQRHMPVLGFFRAYCDRAVDGKRRGTQTCASSHR